MFFEHLQNMEKPENFTLAIALDTSGSIDGEMAKKYTEFLKKGSVPFLDFVVHVWCFSHQIDQHSVFLKNNMRDMLKLQFPAGGGSDSNINWKYMKRIKLLPDYLVIVSADGYIQEPSPEYLHVCPVAFLIPDKLHFTKSDDIKVFEF